MTRIVTGFNEYNPQEQRVFDSMINKISEVYNSNNYNNMDTPVLEYQEELLKKSNGETAKQVYSLTKGKSELCMRYDLTVPLSLYIARNMNSISFPFKRMQLGKVYRGEKRQRGRYREFYQFDIDILNRGTLSPYNDYEVVSLAIKAIQSVTTKEIQVRANNRKVLEYLFSYYNCELTQEVISILDDYLKLEKVIACQRLRDNGVSEELMEVISSGELPDIDYTPIQEDYKDLSLLLSIPEVIFDMTIIRGLDYYTGNVFETFFKEDMSLDSVCSGGRYSDLMSLYSSESFPGVGISIGVTRLFDLIKGDLLSIKELTLIAPMSEENIPSAIKKSKEIPNSNVLYDIKKSKKVFQYATQNKYTQVILWGDKEEETGEYTIKELSYE